MSQTLYELLQQCTVKLVLPDGSNWGTGFFVAKEKILTCAHVVAGYENQRISVQWRGQNLGTATVVKPLPELLDLALLHCELPLLEEHPPCPMLDEEFQPFHRLYIYGYPDDFHEGAGVTVQCEGDAIDQGFKLIKFQAGQIRPGYSGAPVLNEKTWKVCGVVSDTRGRTTDLGGLAVSITEVIKHFPDLQLQNQQFREYVSSKGSQQLLNNPFEGQAAVESLAYYAGREELLRQIFEELNKGSNRSLVGEAQVGKTWLLKQICRKGKSNIKRQIDAFIYLDMRCIEDGKDFFEALCTELKIDPPVRGYKLQRTLQGKQYVLCLDEIDQFSDDLRFTRIERDQLYSLCDGEDMPISLVIASQVSLRQLFPDLPNRTSPLIGICKQIDVNLISLLQVQEFVAERLRGTRIQFSEAKIQELHKECQGKPKLLLELASKCYQEMIKAV